MKKSVILSTNENVLVNVGTEQLKNSKKLLRIKIDSKLKFKDQLSRICIKSQCRTKCFGRSARLNES